MIDTTTETKTMFVMPPTPEFPGVDPEVAERALEIWRDDLSLFVNELDIAARMFMIYPDLVRETAERRSLPEAIAEALDEDRTLEANVSDGFLDPQCVSEALATAEGNVAQRRRKEKEAAAKEEEDKKIEAEIAAFKIMTQDELNKAVMHNALGRYLEAIMRDDRKKQIKNGWRCEPGEYSVDAEGDIISEHRGNLTHTR